MKKHNLELRSLAKSFEYAFKGIIYCIDNERNMRIHIAFTSIVVLFAFFYGLTAFQSAALALCIGLVISMEMLNTAVETLVNLQSPSYNNFARIAKDVAAGAVLVSAIVAAVCGFFLFSDLKKLSAAFNAIIVNPAAIIAFCLLIIVNAVFVFKKQKLYSDNYIKVYKMKNGDKK